MPAIHVENLGKRYYLNHATGRLAYRTLRDTLTDVLSAPWRRWKNGAYSGTTEEFWALNDVSFDVEPGEVVGVIGRNGAGKSTLLKILSRITRPTTGLATIHGRVASLLEVGTGFNLELTGRENVYLSGAILGMTRREIDRKFDEIVDFSGVERFLDTPVKRYSSGMKVRLGFAVAAHLEPEILIVDEVLAVGDADFQRKCLGKMQDVARVGRTVLFVSHNMIAVENLCERLLWLEEGQVYAAGDPASVIRQYVAMTSPSVQERVWDDPETAPGNESVSLRRVSVAPLGGAPDDPIDMTTDVEVVVEFYNHRPGTVLDTTLHVLTEQGIVAFGSGTPQSDCPPTAFDEGLVQAKCVIPGDLMNEGSYRLSLLVLKDRGTLLYRHDNIVSFDILDNGHGRVSWFGKRAGIVRPRLRWQMSSTPLVQ